MPLAFPELSSALGASWAGEAFPPALLAALEEKGGPSALFSKEGAQMSHCTRCSSTCHSFVERKGNGNTLQPLLPQSTLRACCLLRVHVECLPVHYTDNLDISCRGELLPAGPTRSGVRAQRTGSFPELRTRQGNGETHQ